MLDATMVVLLMAYVWTGEEANVGTFAIIEEYVPPTAPGGDGGRGRSAAGRNRWGTGWVWCIWCRQQIEVYWKR